METDVSFDEDNAPLAWGSDFGEHEVVTAIYAIVETAPRHAELWLHRTYDTHGNFESAITVDEVTLRTMGRGRP